MENKFVFNKKAILLDFTFVFISLIVLLGLMHYVSLDPYVKDLQYQEVTYEARVLEIIDSTENTFEYSSGLVTDRNVFFTAITTNSNPSNRRDIVLSVYQNINSYASGDIKEVEVGDKVLVTSIGITDYLLELDDDEPFLFSDVQFNFTGYVQFDVVTSLLIAFALSLILFGKLKGLKTLISLTFTCLVIFFVFIPAVLAGHNIYLFTIIVSVYTVFMTLLIIGGFSKKTITAITGCLVGILFTSLLTLFMDSHLQLTGLINSDSMYLLNLDTDNPINLKAIIFSMITIGAIGAIMDVSTSISSALWEISENSSATFKELFKSGINIGQDLIGTMANTLVLAYIGSSLSLIVLLYAFNSSVVEMINREMIIVEIIQSVIGSFSMLLSIPVTAFISAYLFSRHEVDPMDLPLFDDEYFKSGKYSTDNNDEKNDDKNNDNSNDK